MNGITTETIGDRYSAGVGYLFLPNDLDRDKYIRYCFNTGTVSIILENGGALHNVQCSNIVLNQLEFPELTSELGSQLIWVNQEGLNYPVVIGIVNRADQTTTLTENQHSNRRTTKSGTSEVLIDGNNPSIIINSDSLTENGADIHIISKNTNSTSKINISASGEVSVSSQKIQANISDQLNISIKNPFEDDKKTIINYTKGLGFNYLDEFDNQIEIIDGKVNIVSDNINIGGDNAKEPILLGDKTVDMIDKILEILGRTQTTTLIGPQPLLTATEFLALRSQLELLKSEKHRIE